MANSLAREAERLGLTAILIGYEPPPHNAATLAPTVPYIQLDRSRTDFAQQLREILHRETVDVAHAQGHIPACHLHAATDGMAQAPLRLATMHVGLNGTRRWFWQIRRALRAMDGVSAVSQDMARTYGRLAGRPVKVLTNGIDLENFAGYRAQGPSQGEPFRFAMLSRLAPEKRHILAIRAADRLIASGHAIELHIAGDGECRARLELLSRTRPWLKLAAVVDPQEFLRDKHGFLLPSKAEGTPLALIEALAAGLPAIVSDLPSLRSLAGDAAAYASASDGADFAQAMERLVANPGHWSRQSLSARRRAQAFDLRKIAAQYRAWYGSLLTQAPHDAVLRFSSQMSAT